MDMVPVALILSSYAQEDTAHSALPCAPVVLGAERRRRGPSAARPRAVLAGMLERAAHAVAPAPCQPAR